MSNAWERFIGARYVRSRSRSGFLSFISNISIAGIAIGVAVLIVVLSVVNGFERELQNRLLAMSADATIEAGRGTLQGWPELRGVVLAQPAVDGVAPYVVEQGMLVHDTRYSGIELRGVEPELEQSVSGLEARMELGSLQDLSERGYKIVLGSELAKALGVQVGDTVTAMIARGVVTPAGLVPRVRRFTVSGIFHAGMFEFDRRMAIVHFSDAQRLFRLRDGVTGLRLKVDDVYRAPSIVRSAAESLNGYFLISDWTRRHSAFFRSIQITKSILFVILSLVVAVAAFNIVSTLVMVVKDKQRDIAILRTAGAVPSNIVRIFVWQGALIGVIGTAIGLVVGVLITVNFELIIGFIETLLGRSLLAADVYFISDLPAELRIADVAFVAGIALGLGLLSTLYPAWRAAKSAPADALRYD